MKKLLRDVGYKRDNKSEPTYPVISMEHKLTQKSSAAHWEALYRSISEKLPWEVDQTPREFESWASILAPGARILDLGCGRGQHTITMAKRGFNTLGIDFSPAAIRAAIHSSRIRKIENIHFEVADILRYHPEEKFDLVYDYSVFHHISREDRQAYAKTVGAATRTGGLLALVCYSDRDPREGFNAQRQRIGKLGNTIFHLSFNEVAETFERDFTIKSYQASMLGSQRMHHAHHFIFAKS